ncbi:hypothetical protein CDAR_481861 [Caerostris darwini]|uniref:Uncharacterized protein n=1 Tax=Caerostris darwini TaxID=1538125 RepID=A0AAV4VW49_9ARAC|nr:hypothetical protein CDAR_481861 [Caerostris darwini]
MQDIKDDVHIQEYRRLDIISGEISKRHMLLSHNPDSIISLSRSTTARRRTASRRRFLFLFLLSATNILLRVGMYRCWSGITQCFLNDLGIGVEPRGEGGLYEKLWRNCYV